MNLSTVCLADSQVDLQFQRNSTPDDHATAQEHLELYEQYRCRVETSIGPERWSGKVQSVPHDSPHDLLAAGRKPSGDALDDHAPDGLRRAARVLDLLCPIAAAVFAFSLIFAGILFVLELNNGTLTNDETNSCAVLTATTDEQSQKSNSSQNDISLTLERWTPVSPVKVTVASAGTAKIIDDHSVRLEGDVPWQEASLQFEFDKPTNVAEIRLEILPVDSPTEPQFGRGGNKLMLFDVKPSIADKAGKSSSLDFASCTYLQDPSDETTVACIDHLSDTGWKVPNLPADATAHKLVLRFEKPITLHAGQRLTLTVDSGGADDLAVLNRIRFAFHQAAVRKPADGREEDALVPPGAKTGTVVLHAIDADSGEPIPNVTFVIENLKGEEWAAPVGKSGDDGRRQLELGPKPGFFFSVYPVPDGYQVTGLDEVPAGVVVGGRVEHRFHLRKRGTNANFPEVLPTPETTIDQLPVPSEFTKSGSIRSSVDNMPGFVGQQIQFVYHPSRTEMAERVFQNGLRVRAAIDNELEYFRRADGEKAGDITEISDVLIAIQANRQWIIRCCTKDGMNLRDGFKVHFNDLESWDLKVPSFVHPDF